MRMQVEQLEKEKKGQSERVRVIAKRLDHTERAYRKEEVPLLAEDYERQMAEDLESYNKMVEQRLQAARDAHAEAVANKKRLSRMMDDYKAKKLEITRKREMEYARKKAEADRMIDEAKEERRREIARALEGERRRKEEEERKRREEEEEASRQEQGTLSRTSRLSCTHII